MCWMKLIIHSQTSMVAPLKFRNWLGYNYTKQHHMMTSSNGNIFRVTGPLCGEFTGPGEFPAQRPVTQSFDVFFQMSDWVNNRQAGDLRRHRGHYDVSVMTSQEICTRHAWLAYCCDLQWSCTGIFHPHLSGLLRGQPWRTQINPTLLIG